MHDYLQVFKNKKIINSLFELREAHDIDSELGTMSKPHILQDDRIPTDLLAGIQLYEYLFYDFIANEKIYSILNSNGQQSLHSVFLSINRGLLINRDDKMYLVSKMIETEVANYIISCLVDHSKYCDLYAKMNPPDYMQVFRDSFVCSNLEYIRVQNGISKLDGLVTKPDIFDHVPPELATSMQIYEYIYYDFLIDQEFHDSLTDDEERSMMNILNMMLRVSCGGAITGNYAEKLAIDMEVANRCLSTRIDNSKYFELYNRSSMCPAEEKMSINNITHSELNEAIQKHKEYIMQKKQAS